MARITVEDCIDKFPSRFELVLVASNRARRLFSGENPTVEKDNDKHTVIALREIASETINSEQLKNDLIEEYQTVTFSEDEDLNESNKDNDDEDTNSEQLIEDHQNIEDNLSDKNVLEKESSDEIENELTNGETQAEENVSET
tara:strand:- start:97 stop:525 length:429 start_codon:yes stop_codon:yes gene_type:complete